MLTAYLQKQQTESLQFCQLQLTFRCIKVINNVPASVRFITRLNLSGNHLMSLNGIQQFHNIEILLFNYNHIALPSQLNKINNPFFIKKLSYIANPLYYSFEMTKETLANMGFTRLKSLNQFQRGHASPPSHSIKIHVERKGGKSANLSLAQTDFTARRRPDYRYSPEEQPKTNKKMIGKIYTTKMKTKRREKQEPPRNTRESTMKQSLEASAQHEPRIYTPEQEILGQGHEVKPFQQLIVDQFGETAKFSQEMSDIQRIGQQFLNGEKEYLADCYYKQNILQKFFHKWKNFKRKTIESELQSNRGQIINNKLQTLHFSLIKLKHQFLQRT